LIRLKYINGRTADSFMRGMHMAGFVIFHKEADTSSGVGGLIVEYGFIRLKLPSELNPPWISGP